MISFLNPSTNAFPINQSPDQPPQPVPNSSDKRNILTKIPSWGVFNSLLGWQNSATYGSVIGYNVFWIFVILGFMLMRFKEKNGRYPFMSTPKAQSHPAVHAKDSSDEESSVASGGRNKSQDKTEAREVTEIKA